MMQNGKQNGLIFNQFSIIICSKNVAVKKKYLFL